MSLRSRLEEATKEKWSFLEGRLFCIVHYPGIFELVSSIWSQIPSGTSFTISKHNEMMGELSIPASAEEGEEA